MSNISDENIEKLYTDAGCIGPFDGKHRCSNLHCEHCGICDAMPAILNLITEARIDELEKVDEAGMGVEGASNIVMATDDYIGDRLATLKAKENK